jgi:hypothetical protein
LLHVAIVKTNLISWLALILLGQAGAWAAIPLVDHGDTWRYRKGTNAPQVDWKTATDAELDGTWASGQGGFGYADNTPETTDCQTLLSDMRGVYSSLYLRRQFEVTNPPGGNARLYLRMDWDDCFMAWMDGRYLTNKLVTVAPNEPPYDWSTTASHESSRGNSGPNPVLSLDLGPATNWLSTGTHTLALMGINGGVSSTDFIQVADLYLETAAEPPSITNGVGGAILADTTWFATNRIYTVTNPITVASNVTLTIEPGVTVWLRQDCGITVNGRLLAGGTTNQLISFTRYPGDLNWERIMFVDAQDSLLRHCTIQYANCTGDHKDAYYATNCDYPMNIGPRTYFEAVVALACHLDVEGCLFSNLYDAAGTLPEGDAIGIFSDDPVHRGPASANIRGCQFRYIGQGINTRYAYVLVEDCYFIGKTGDNDDVELYGESSLYGLPNPVVRNNVFDVPAYDDRIHPTRCSALIYGNLILGSTDHAIVLRDTCCPIVFNNLIYPVNSSYSFPSGGIAIQNGCDAMIVNNTFVGVNSAIKLFDHQDRITYPYCLSALSGRATVINCLIWNGNNAIDVSGSMGAPFQEFQVSVSYCNIQGGTNSIYHGSNTKYQVEWGPGNLSADPRFLNAAARDYHLSSNSPCLDAGGAPGIVVTTNTMFVDVERLLYAVTNDLNATVTNDFERLPRPLDGQGDGTARFDIGAYEVLLPNADSNGDGIPDGWSQQHGLNPTAPDLAAADPDLDGFSNTQEYVADTDPTDPLSFFHLEPIPPTFPAAARFLSSANRHYTLFYTTDLAQGVWSNVPTQTGLPGTGELMTLSETNPAATGFYRVGVQVP